VEGLILAPTGQSVESTRTLLRAKVPVVVVDRDLPGSPGSTVLVDNHHGGYLATRHLIDHGHRRIAILSGPADVSSAAERRRGWAQAMDEAGLQTEGLAFDIAFTRESAYQVALQLLGAGDPPTALFATADEQALGLFRAAAERGLRVPHDLAVVSFDSTDAAPYLVPALTAVHQPTDAIAARAVAVLLAQIEDPERAPTRDSLPVELVVRGSCGCGEPLAAGASRPGATSTLISSTVGTSSRVPPKRRAPARRQATSTSNPPDPRRNP
jgi:LacI family transcriptional regulator